VLATLGENSTLWVRSGSQWLAWPGWQPSGPNDRLGSVRIVELLESAARRQAPTSIASPPDRHVLAVPFAEADVLIVAVALLAADELPERLAAALRHGLALSSKMDGISAVAEGCFRQISEDMEHVVFLQTLGEHLQLCEVSRSLLEVVQGVLPTLRDMIRAESVVFLTASPESDDAGNCVRNVASVACRLGREDIDADVCRDLVRQFGAAARQKPVIRNRLQKESGGASLPGVNNFLLAEVAKRDLHAGWLLALNRMPDLVREKPVASYPAWGLSDAEFGSVESGLMVAAAGMLATHACNVELFRERERLLIGVLQSLVHVMDAKDPYTRGHSDRVALVARRVAEELGLSREECNTVYISGLLHDIGKIGVPDSLLLKPSPLTNEESVRVQQHSERGHAILKHLEHLAHALPGVRHHHERYDGRGYPCGLRGEAIPLVARILAVADSYDAMTSDRPYRAAMSRTRCEAMLKEGAGPQWDPRIVETFLRIFPEIDVICRNAQIPVQDDCAASVLSGATVDIRHDGVSAILDATPFP
jgi:HD-GYP domain-containing protein (c-di-GMP phosphodiesterase class II)